MRNTNIITNSTTARGSERLNRKDFPFFHLGLVVVPDKRDRFPTVDMVLFDVVGGKATDGFHGVCLAADVDFVAFHGFLDGGAHVTDTDVDASCLQKGWSVL